MKAYTHPIGILVMLAGVFYAITKDSATGPNPENRDNEVVMCATEEKTILPVTLFTPNLNPTPAAALVRKNIYSLTAAEINSIKTGIAAMKALPITNKTSWLYQAAIHGTTSSPAQPSWNTCQHGTQFFLSWHRMYLYYFERILRAKSGNPNLTLPYWDYQTNPALHPEYRNSAATNPLYDGTRNASINGGGSLPASISTSINTALSKIPFNVFQSGLEGPHGSVHVSIGGNMGAVNRAGQDPVFWLHHTNVDRVWSQWIRMCGGRQNPNDAAWLNPTYTFFDENGNAVNMTGSQVVNTAANLNYVYDFPLSLPCNIKWPFLDWVVIRPFKLPRPFTLNQTLIRTSFKEAVATPDAQKITNLALNLNSQELPDQVLVDLNGVKVERLPEGVIEVYLNLPDNEKPTPQSRSFVGVLDLFTAGAHATHTRRQIPIRINISDAAARLGIKMATDLSKIDLSFVVRGNTFKGQVVDARSSVSVADMDIVIERPVKK